MVIRVTISGTTVDLFSLIERYSISVKTIVVHPLCKGRQDICVEFNAEHKFNWIEKEKWYFLKMKI